MATPNLSCLLSYAILLDSVVFLLLLCSVEASQSALLPKARHASACGQLKAAGLLLGVSTSGFSMWGYEKEENHNFMTSQMEKLIRGNGLCVVGIGWKSLGQSWLFGSLLSQLEFLGDLVI